MVTDLPERIRERLCDPRELCRSLNLLDGSRRQGGGGVLIRCPVHNERSPSCSVTVAADATVRWKCFACSAGGTALHLISVVHGLDTKADFPRVLEIGAQLAGIQVDAAAPWQPAPEAPARPALDPEPPALDDETFDAIVRPLATLGRLDGRGLSTPICKYLDGRGLLAAARADGWFAIGPHAGEMLVDMFGLDTMKRSGLVDAAGALKWSEHSLAIPWRAPSGLVQTIQRRHLGDCDAAKRYVFPTGRGPQHPYGIERLSGIGPIAIVEGAPDVLARRILDDLGWATIVGAPGVSGWRASWDELARDRIMIVAFDDDAAGNREAVKIGDRLRAAGALDVRRATPKRGKDWAEAMQP